MAKKKENTVVEEPVIRAKEWVRHKLLVYGMEMNETAGLSQKDAEKMLEECREKKREQMQQPATDAQKKELEKLGIPIGEGMTVKEASDAMRDHYRKAAPQATEAQMQWIESHHIKGDIVTKAEASRAIARHIAREEIPRYQPPVLEKGGKYSPKDLYLIEARRQYEANDRSFQNFDEIGVIKKMMSENVSESTIRSTVSVYSPLHAKCTEKQLDYMVSLANSDKRVKIQAEEKKKMVRPPSEKQLEIMKRKKIAYTEGMSSLQANALIARKINLEMLQNHKPGLSKERNPVEFYRSFAQAELRKIGWDVKRYSEGPAVIAMSEHGFTKSIICETLNDNSPKCGKSMDAWLNRQVTGILEKHKKQELERAAETEAKVKEAPIHEVSPMASLGAEVPFEDEPEKKQQESVRENVVAASPAIEESQTLKYELTNVTLSQEGMLLRRIRALRDIPSIGVKEGDFGGYVLSSKNLSQEGNCWVAEDAKVSRNAMVCDDAVVCRTAEVTDRAIVAGQAWVDGESHIQGNAVVIDDAVVNGHGVVAENGFVSGDGFVNGFACVKGNGVVAEGGIRGKAVVDSYAEDLSPYLSDLQQSFRETMQAEYSRFRAVAEKVAQVQNFKDVKAPVITRPVRQGLEQDGLSVRKKPVRRKNQDKKNERKTVAKRKM